MPARIISLTTLLILAFAATANAGMMTVSDPNSDFTVTYNTDEAGLFGTLFLSHNTIFFVPDSFTAQSTNGAGIVITSETLNLQLEATTQGFTFDSFSLQETLDYIVDGDSSEVSASGEMRVRDVNAAMSEFRDGFNFIADADGGPATQQTTGTALIDSAMGWMGADDQVLLTLQNTLTASTGAAGELAFIQKKFEGIEISVNPVPVPAAAWLLGSALLGLFGFRRNPSSQHKAA